MSAVHSLLPQAGEGLGMRGGENLITILQLNDPHPNPLPLTGEGACAAFYKWTPLA
jgi:hypothetical protein